MARKLSDLINKQPQRGMTEQSGHYIVGEIGPEELIIDHSGHGYVNPLYPVPRQSGGSVNPRRQMYSLDNQINGPNLATSGGLNLTAPNPTTTVESGPTLGYVHAMMGEGEQAASTPSTSPKQTQGKFASKKATKGFFQGRSTSNKVTTAQTSARSSPRTTTRTASARGTTPTVAPSAVYSLGSQISRSNPLQDLRTPAPARVTQAEQAPTPERATRAEQAPTVEQPTTPTRTTRSAQTSTRSAQTSTRTPVATTIDPRTITSAEIAKMYPTSITYDSPYFQQEWVQIQTSGNPSITPEILLNTMQRGEYWQTSEPTLASQSIATRRTAIPRQEGGTVSPASSTDPYAGSSMESGISSEEAIRRYAIENGRDPEEYAAEFASYGQLTPEEEAHYNASLYNGDPTYNGDTSPGSEYWDTAAHWDGNGRMPTGWVILPDGTAVNNGAVFNRWELRPPPGAMALSIRAAKEGSSPTTTQAPASAQTIESTQTTTPAQTTTPTQTTEKRTPLFPDFTSDLNIGGLWPSDETSTTDLGPFARLLEPRLQGGEIKPMDNLDENTIQELLRSLLKGSPEEATLMPPGGLGLGGPGPKPLIPGSFGGPKPITPGGLGGPKPLTPGVPGGTILGEPSPSMGTPGQQDRLGNMAPEEILKLIQSLKGGTPQLRAAGGPVGPPAAGPAPLPRPSMPPIGPGAAAPAGGAPRPPMPPMGAGAAPGGAPPMPSPGGAPGAGGPVGAMGLSPQMLQSILPMIVQVVMQMMGKGGEPGVAPGAPGAPPGPGLQSLLGASAGAPGATPGAPGLMGAGPAPAAGAPPGGAPSAKPPLPPPLPAALGRAVGPLGTKIPTGPVASSMPPQLPPRTGLTPDMSNAIATMLTKMRPKSGMQAGATNPQMLRDITAMQAAKRNPAGLAPPNLTQLLQAKMMQKKLGGGGVA
jgi:hypothetical protein